jgi:hypothetical protein
MSPESFPHHVVRGHYHYLTDSVRESQAERRWRENEAIFKRFANLHQVHLARSVDQSRLLLPLDDQHEDDMEHYASNLAVDYMQAYYKVRKLDPARMVVLTCAAGCPEEHHRRLQRNSCRRLSHQTTTISFRTRI